MELWKERLLVHRLGSWAYLFALAESNLRAFSFTGTYGACGGGGGWHGGGRGVAKGRGGSWVCRMLGEVYGFRGYGIQKRKRGWGGGTAVGWGGEGGMNKPK